MHKWQLLDHDQNGGMHAAMPPVWQFCPADHFLDARMPWVTLPSCQSLA
jgi:hypothetical protein